MELYITTCVAMLKYCKAFGSISDSVFTQTYTKRGYTRTYPITQLQRHMSTVLILAWAEH